MGPSSGDHGATHEFSVPKPRVTPWAVPGQDKTRYRSCRQETGPQEMSKIKERERERERAELIRTSSKLNLFH